MSTTTRPTGQYTTSDKLAARAQLYQRSEISEIGWFPFVAQRLGLENGDKVLDIGCGPGWFWAANADALPGHLDLTLADKSAGMVSEALERCRPLRHWTVTGREADASALPFADASFDAVVAMHMLYHVPDATVAIAEMHRVLKPGGILAVTTNGERNLKELYALTTAFGASPTEPVAAIFGFAHAERLLRERFGNVTAATQPARLRVTDPEIVFLALTSYPPGETAPDDQLAAFRDRIGEAFARGGGALDVEKQSGVFVSRKS